MTEGAGAGVRHGPLESRSWPDALEAYAVEETPGGVRLHGYDVESDLAVHYSFTDVVYLSLTGELPDSPQRSRAFGVVLTFLLPHSVAHAATHAGVLAGFCSAPPSGIIATSAVGLAQEAVASLAEAESVDVASGPLPEALRAHSPEDVAAVQRLRVAMDGLLEVPLLTREPSRELALCAVLRACGLRTPLQIAAAFTLARLPSVVAEAEVRSAQNFVEKYPLDTPPFVYESA